VSEVVPEVILAGGLELGDDDARVGALAAGRVQQEAARARQEAGRRQQGMCQAAQAVLFEECARLCGGHGGGGGGGVMVGAMRGKGASEILCSAVSLRRGALLSFCILVGRVGKATSRQN